MTKIFVINLENAKEKRKKIQKNLNNFNISYELFPAINGHTTSHNKICKYWYDPNNHRYLTKGELGCALSHYNIWKKIADENISRAIILEDDVTIVDKDFLKKVENIPLTDYDFMYLGRKKISNNPEQIYNNNTELVIPQFSYWLCAYCITNNGAKYLANSLFLNNLLPVDEYVPYMIGTNNNHIIHNIFKNIKKNIKSLAFKNNLIKPVSEAFQNSSTLFSNPCDIYHENISLITVATDMNDAVQRYINSCNNFGFNPIVLGMNTEWKGGDMASGPGGGHKITLLKEFLEKETENKLIIFTDSYDVICNNNINILINIYKSKYNGKIVFGSEKSCWPEKSLSNKYPSVKNTNKYLNSGVFMGYAHDIKKIINKFINNRNDDQLYYTMQFLIHYHNKIKPDIVLDYDNELFYCLNDSTEDYKLHITKSLLSVNNKIPCFVHGNGPSYIKRELNHIANYTSNYYNEIYGYKNIFKRNTLPTITILFDEEIKAKSNVINGIINLKYQKDKLEFIYYYNDIPNEIICKNFKNLKLIKKSSQPLAELTKIINTDMVFYINSYIVLENPNTLNILVEENKNIIAPMVTCIKNNLFSNFWGEVDNKNYYKRSKNYLNIVNRSEKSCWNVSYIWYCMLIDRKFFIDKYFQGNQDIDMNFSNNMRKNNIFLNILNTHYFGFYDESLEKTSDVELLDFEKYQFNWEQKYLHDSFKKQRELSEISNDIYTTKIFSQQFCNDIIRMAEENNSWSKGGNSHYDKRIGNKENHPTQDIHLNQLGLDKMWDYILKTYIGPMIYSKFKYSYKNVNISFVVKYSLDGQKELRPHHDSSTFTVNICLNDDFEGGGCHFVTKNKTIIHKDVGSIIIHPGRLTHYHTGLPITSGTRYVLISFVN